MKDETQVMFKKFRNESTTNNVLYYSKVLLFIMTAILGYFILFVMDTIFHEFFFVMIGLILSLIIVRFLLFHSLFYAEYYSGLFIYICFLVLILNFLKISREKNLAIEKYAGELTQYFNLISLTLIQNPKLEILLSVIYQLGKVYLKLKFGDVIDADIILDYSLTVAYFSILTYYINSVNVNLFLSFKINIKKAIKELSKGMDKLSENLCMLSVSSNNNGEDVNLNIYQISSQFLNYLNQDSNLDKHFIDDAEIKAEEFLNNFIFIANDISNLKAKEVEKLTKIAVSSNATLYYDILKFCSSKKIDSCSNLKEVYHTGIYIIKSPDLNKYRYFEVRYVKYINSSVSEKPFILLLFKDIENEKYMVKSQQMNTFSNILVSSFTHELNNPLNGLNGLLFSLKNEVNEIEEQINSLKLSNKVDNFNNKIKGIKYNINQIAINFKFVKYSHEKINIIAKNFTCFSKLKLKLPLNFKIADLSLKYILEKTLKLFKSLALINNIKLNLNVEILSFYFIKTDFEYFRIILSNIILMVEKHCKNTELSLFILDKDNNKIKDTLKELKEIKLCFYLRNILINKNSKLNDIEADSLDIINVFTFNNKHLSSHLNCVYDEVYNGVESLKIELTLKGVYTFPFIK